MSVTGKDMGYIKEFSLSLSLDLGLLFLFVYFGSYCILYYILSSVQRVLIITKYHYFLLSTFADILHLILW